MRKRKAKIHMLTKSANLKESKKTSAFITNLWFESCPYFTPHLEISLCCIFGQQTLVELHAK